MKSSSASPAVGTSPQDEAVRPQISGQSVESARTLRVLLISLMIPVGMLTLEKSMFGVALPALRDAFNAEADVVAWLVTAYSLPFVIFMPLFGKLGDSLGKSRLFQTGIGIFFLGSFVCLMANSLPVLLVGRVLQGIGAAGINPLCIAIIAERFPPSQQGKAMGTWSSMAPGASMLGPLLSGYAVDTVGWNYIFLISMVTALVALWVVYRQVPSQSAVNLDGLRRFDWLGAGLLGATLVISMFYLSSRSVTGVEPLRDWRLLLAAVGLGLAFWRWERRTSNPLVNFELYQRKNFGAASLAASFRMVIMHTVSFLNALFLTDVYDLGATGIGLFAMIFAGAILATTRLGGQLSDRMHSRYILLTSFVLQIAALYGLAAFSLPLLGAAGLMLLQALAAGLALATLHRVAMEEVPPAERGAAAGLYSTARFGGGVIGATLAGVALQQAQLFAPGMEDAYQWVFALTATISLGSLVVAWRIKK